MNVVCGYKPCTTPGPIQAVGTHFLYQLNVESGNSKEASACNLWQANFQTSNGHDPVHAEHAVKLFLAAPKLLVALEQAIEALRCGDPNARLNAMRDGGKAIAQAKPLETM